jgi:hypothetical protein
MRRYVVKDAMIRFLKPLKCLFRDHDWVWNPIDMCDDCRRCGKRYRVFAYTVRGAPQDSGDDQDMSEDAQPEHSRDSFNHALTKLIDLYRQEYDLTYADAIGVLEMQKFTLCKEAHDLENEPYDE